ncbi:hypothetical protein DTO282F9_2848 [Paecilomyces variotii]|nr:hypothetical protein DTO282E5_1795 [Paecilomyces variotii]KAJ9388321.1 hypothetical protein DTO063F5_2652 [Paecilomyces variotii]KAJ9400380.1 hypothetical protein DTO282F9_2848 [Paecilomyces variotii]
MASLESQYSPTLEQFPLRSQKIHVLDYAGGGNAAYVFKVLIDGKTYALKMFKFDNPLLNPSRLRGISRRAVYDNFFIECRANASLIRQELNGKITPFCHGWILVPTKTERDVAKHFNVQSFLWDRPPNATNEKVRALLFDWVDGKMVSQIRITAHIADQIRNALKELHQASIAHRDIRAANILVTKDRVYLIDLNSAWILSSPPEISSQKLKDAQEEDHRSLEAGFVLLSQINDGESVADLSLLGGLSPEEILTIYDPIKCHWRPQPRSFWHSKR